MELTRLPSELIVEDIVLRRPDPEHAAAVVEAVNDSLRHLRPWMAWAQRPAEVEPTALRLALAGASFDAGGDASWTIFDAATARVIGACGLHDRIGGAARNIGYWVRMGWTGRGVASRAAAAITTVGFEVLSLDRIEVHCDQTNERSAAVPRRLGFQYVGSVEGLCGAPSDSGRMMVWAMSRAAWASLTADGAWPLRR